LVPLISGFAVIAFAFTGYALWLGNSIPRGTAVEGIALGGMNLEEARRALASGVRERTGPVTVLAGSESLEIRPLASGLSVDIPGTIERLPRREFNPLWLVDHLINGGDRKLEVEVDQVQLKRSLRALSLKVTEAAVDGGIVFRGRDPIAIAPKPGTALDLAALAQAIKTSWLDGQRQFPVAVIVAEPVVSAAEVERALVEFARPAVSEPVTVVVDGHPVVASRKVIAGSLQFAVDAKGRLEPNLIASHFTEALGSAWAQWVVPARNASLRTINGQVSVVPSIKGRDVPAAQLQAAVLPALIKTGTDRVAVVATTDVDPPLTTDAALDLDLRERIGYFQTQFPWTSYRAHNIRRAADILNGTIFKPGEVFSLNGVLGQRTAANGFVEGVVISGGRLSKDFGGGVSQIATTIWNAAWFAGLELIQHKPHSFYISRYPVGRESTVSWPNVDVKFRNNTDKPILITTSYYSNYISVSIYGNRKYEVETITGPRTNPTTFESYDDDSPTCINQIGIPGFTIEVTRILKDKGVEVSRKVYRTRYLAEDRVRCTNPEATFGNSPAPKPKPTPKPTSTPAPTESLTPTPTSAP
jgi:vancomycin resistance protein YoaR